MSGRMNRCLSTLAICCWRAGVDGDGRFVVGAVAFTLLRKDLDELLPERVEVCADLHLHSTVTKTAQTASIAR